MRWTRAFGLWLLLGVAPAMAEDFSGFYAGMNAGWAFKRGGTAPVSMAPGPPRDTDGLPPSVSRIEERRRPETPAAGRGR